MQRRWQVHPDETGIVSREALISAFIDAATMLDIAGGTLSVVTGRMPTGLPGEMVTTGAVFEWRDRTDAKPQPEPASTVTTQPEDQSDSAQWDGGGGGGAERTGQDAPEDGFKYAAEPKPEAVEPDGFDYSQLQDEDVEEAAEVTR